MIVSGGICASPGPALIVVFFAVATGIERVSPGRIRFVGVSSVNIVVYSPWCEVVVKFQ